MTVTDQLMQPSPLLEIVLIYPTTVIATFTNEPDVLVEKGPAKIWPMVIILFYNKRSLESRDQRYVGELRKFNPMSFLEAVVGKIPGRVYLSWNVHM